MKITILYDSKIDLLAPSHMSLGGIETATIELALALARLNHEIELRTACERELILNGVKNLPIKKGEHYSCDVFISVNHSKYFDYTQCDKKILWLHNPINIEKVFRKGMTLSILKHRPHIVFGSLYAEHAMTTLYPFKSRSVIPLGISKEFLESNIELKRNREFVYASQPHRGLDLTLQAWIDALPHLPDDASLNIFGVERDHFASYANNASRHRIIFHPRATKATLAKFYETAYAMVYPGAKDETFCLAAAEAQCSGLPVITMGIGSLRERVSTGVNGIVCQSKEQFSRAISELANNDDLYQLLKKGAKLQRQTADWDRVAKLWLNYFSAL